MGSEIKRQMSVGYRWFFKPHGNKRNHSDQVHRAKKTGPRLNFEEIHDLQMGCGVRRKTSVVLPRQRKEGFRRVGSQPCSGAERLGKREGDQISRFAGDSSGLCGLS